MHWEKHMKVIKAPFRKVYGFVSDMMEDRVGVYTAQSSFFMVLSLFPFLILLLNLIHLSPVKESFLLHIVEEYAPGVVKPILTSIFREMSKRTTRVTVSFTAIFSIWTASKAVASIMFGLFEVYKVHQKRNYFISRFFSILYTIFFLFVFSTVLILIVFGGKLASVAISINGDLEILRTTFTIFRYILVFLILMLFFTVTLRIADFRHVTFAKALPGSFLGTIAWIVFSYGFSIYIDNIVHMSYMYGSLTTVIVLMLWFYFSFYIFFIAAEFNKHIFPELDAVYRKKIEATQYDESFASIFELDYDDEYDTEFVSNNNDSASKDEYLHELEDSITEYSDENFTKNGTN